jgi:hypothetical protein
MKYQLSATLAITMVSLWTSQLSPWEQTISSDISHWIEPGKEPTMLHRLSPTAYAEFNEILSLALPL